jgi:hypothetical protein
MGAVFSSNTNNLHGPWFGRRIAYWNVVENGDGVTGPSSFAYIAGGVMSVTLIFLRKWNGWYRVLHYGKGFSFVDSVRFGLWLARG